MVFKVIQSGVSGDLNNVFDNYGFFDDTVLILDGTPGTVIRTYEGNDYIFGGRITILARSAAFMSSTSNPEAATTHSSAD